MWNKWERSFKLNVTAVKLVNGHLLHMLMVWAYVNAYSFEIDDQTASNRSVQYLNLQLAPITAHLMTWPIRSISPKFHHMIKKSSTRFFSISKKDKGFRLFLLIWTRSASRLRKYIFECQVCGICYQIKLPCQMWLSCWLLKRFLQYKIY